MNAQLKPATTDYKIRDLSLAELGRKRSRMAEEEMPGLMSIRAKYAPLQPLQGVRLTGSLHITKETAVLLETLGALGESVRWEIGRAQVCTPGTHAHLVTLLLRDKK